MAWVGAAVAVVGTVLQMKGEKEAQLEKEAGYEMRSRQLKSQAGQVRATGQRAAKEEYRDAEYFASRAIAVAAASGSSASDPTVVKTVADIHGEGAYRASLELYKAEEEARNLEYEADQAKRGILSSRSAYQTNRQSTILQAASSAYANYSNYKGANSKPKPASSNPDYG